jgi:phosphatidate phosphatase PAH1
LSGISDVIVIKYPNGFYKSTPFLACFGSHCVLSRDELISIQVNDKHIIKTKNKVNRHGYMSEVHMTQE